MSLFQLNTLKLSNGKEWRVAKACFDKNSDLYRKAVEQATMKSKYTMDASQSGQYRSPELKFNRQLMGTIAEIAVQQFLTEGIEELGITASWSIIRYDDVRTDGFKSPENEYDIKAFKLTVENKMYFIESRSSIVKDRSLASAIESFHIIGSYNSVAKNQENANDFYLLPLHFVKNNASSYLPSKYKDYFENDDLQLFIVAGCSYNFLTRQGSINNLKQGATKYKVIKAAQATDAYFFKEKFTEFLNVN